MPDMPFVLITGKVRARNCRLCSAAKNYVVWCGYQHAPVF